MPLDGEMASPIERMFLGYVSHHQVYREIDCFVAVGTLAMCHVKKVKGSDLEPKVRWAVAIGQRHDDSPQLGLRWVKAAY